MKIKKFDQFLNEKAVSSEDVYTNERSVGVVIFKKKKRSKDEISIALFDFDRNAVIGYAISEKFKTEDYYHSHRVFGIEKHGPLMLELMMSAIYPTGIIPDRTIKPRAVQMYEIFSRRPDVIVKPLSPEDYWYATEYSTDIDHEHLKDPKVINIINNVYSLKTKTKYFDVLVDRGETLMKKHKVHPLTIIQKAEDVFNSVYQTNENRRIL